MKSNKMYWWFIKPPIHLKLMSPAIDIFKSITVSIRPSQKNKHV